MSAVIVRYGELSLKSHSVRKRFTDKLIGNIQNALMDMRIEGYIEEERGRIYVFTDEPEKASEVIRNVFGVVSVSTAEVTDSDMDSIAKLAVSLFGCKKGSFAVRATRHGNHRYTSQELAAYVGEKILDNCSDLRVNLKKPDFELFIEVRNSRAFVFLEKIRGIGGMPLGTQGTVASYMRDEMDLLSAWMLMRRGCRVVFSGESPENLVRYAKKWGAIALEGKIDEILNREQVFALVSGRLEECRNDALPVFCPTAGLSEEDVEERLEIIFS